MLWYSNFSGYDHDLSHTASQSSAYMHITRSMDGAGRKHHLPDPADISQVPSPLHPRCDPSPNMNRVVGYWVLARIRTKPDHLHLHLHPRLRLHTSSLSKETQKKIKKTSRE